MSRSRDRDSLSRKPLLSCHDQIEHLARCGIAFQGISKSDAEAYLSTHEGLVHLGAYRKLFPTRSGCCGRTLYIDLDFSDLIRVSEFDSLLRELLLVASMDVERSGRTNLLRIAPAHEGADGHGIVRDFLDASPTPYRDRIERALRARGNRSGPGWDTYSGPLIERNMGDMPLWAFTEVIDFGTLLSLIRFYSGRWSDGNLRDDYYILKQVKAIRNACAHGSCIVNGFTSGEKSSLRLANKIYPILASSGIKQSRSRAEKLSNPRILQIVSLGYCFARHPPLEVKTRRRPRFEEVLRESSRLRGRYVGDSLSFPSYLLFFETVVDKLILGNR